MKRLLPALFALAASAAALRAAEPSLELSLDRGRIYLGESVVAEVSLKDFDGTPPVPAFSGGSPAKVEYGGPRSFTQSFTSFVNGRRETKTSSSTVFTFVITPEKAGAFDTGAVSVDAGGRRLSAASRRVIVLAPQSPDFLSLSLSCPDKSVTVESGFSIRLEVGFRALPEPFAGYEPFSAKAPVAISARFLDFPETQGLKSPAPQDALEPFVSNSPSLPFFKINGYTTSSSILPGFPSFASPFSDPVAKFRPAPERRDVNGTNWWFYAFSFDFVALEEGEYTFGPVSLKGSVFSAPPGGGDPAPSDVYAVAPAVTVMVTPPPEEGRPGCFCGGVGRSMQVKASIDTQKCKVGDPLVLSVDLTGDVNPMSLRPPPLGDLPGLSRNFRIYADHVESESVPGGKRFKFRLRPLSPGTLEVPAVKAAFYDIRESRYVTVASDAIPIQVEATAQISVSGADGADAGEAILPDGIAWNPADDFTLAASGPGAAVDSAELVGRCWPAWLLAPPLLWLLAFALRNAASNFRRFRVDTAVRRDSARARRAFLRAVRRGPSAQAAGRAASALRDFSSAVLSDPSRSLTSGEAGARLATGGFPAGASRAFTQAFAAFEGAQFGTGPDGSAAVAEAGLREADSAMREIAAAAARPHAGRARLSALRLCGSLLLFALSAATSAAVILTACGGGNAGHVTSPPLLRTPPAFDWERAQDAMASANDAASFAAAAHLYSELVSSGYATGPLFHNLGVALLLSGEPRAAAASLDIAANWTGMLREVRQNRLLAAKALSGSSSLPLQIYAFPWHFLLHMKWRIALSALFWCLAWAFLAIALAFRGSRARRCPVRLACITAALFVAFAGSVAISLGRVSSPVNPMPEPAGIAAAADATETPPEYGGNLP